jgi:hypothetical protein
MNNEFRSSEFEKTDRQIFESNGKFQTPEKVAGWVIACVSTRPIAMTTGTPSNDNTPHKGSTPPKPPAMALRLAA